MTLYNSHFIPIITYCFIIWGDTAKCHLDQISVSQRQVLKNILEVEQHTASTEVYRMTKTLSINMYTLHTLVSLYKLVHQLIPSTLHGMFIPRMKSYQVALEVTICSIFPFVIRNSKYFVNGPNLGMISLKTSWMQNVYQLSKQGSKAIYKRSINSV